MGRMCGERSYDGWSYQWQIAFTYVTDTDFLQAEWVLTLAHRHLAQWRFLCHPAIRNVSLCVWKILEQQRLHVLLLMRCIWQKLLQEAGIVDRLQT